MESRCLVSSSQNKPPITRAHWAHCGVAQTPSDRTPSIVDKCHVHMNVHQSTSVYVAIVSGLV